MMCLNPNYSWYGKIGKYFYLSQIWTQVSFRKSLNWIHGIQVMAAERDPKLLIKRRGGVVEHFSTANSVCVYERGRVVSR